VTPAVSARPFLDPARTVRDVIVTHPHMDHIASLPIYVDDLFGELEQPIRIHATQEVIDLLERDVFNDNVYPRFAELRTNVGRDAVRALRSGERIRRGHLQVTAVTSITLCPRWACSSLTADRGGLQFRHGGNGRIWKMINRHTSRRPFHRSFVPQLNAPTRRGLEAFDAGNAQQRVD